MKTRREFIKKTSALTAFGLFADWASANPVNDKFGEVLPQRQLIRNGEKTTAFGMGGYHLGITLNPKEAEKMIERAMELGVRFYDNARGYHAGRSEEYMGKFLTPKYREDIFLMTKSPGSTAKEAQKHLDESLKALNTDYLDLWQMHALNRPEDVDNRLNAGVLDVFLEAREKGKTRYIGFTGHQNPKTHLHFLEILKARGLEMETVQMPMNVCDSSFESFQNKLLPVLLERGYGAIAMKTMAGGSMMGKRIDTTPAHIKTEDIPDMVGKEGIALSKLHQYVYGLPVSVLCSGCANLQELEDNVKTLRELKKLSETEMKDLEALAKPYAGMIVENYKRVF
ncbi:MAG: aldo/keto reductase [Cyclobacteriaceae bacterium]|nr:aldo/keto reductase [Cyclobacteriaceae bacterium]